MPKRLCENWLREYMQYTRHLESPDVCHFWTGVSTIASVLRRRVWIEQHAFQWVPNFYIFLVGPPGIIAKSTTLDQGTRLLRKVDGIVLGPDVITWQALTKAFSDAQTLVKVPGTDDFEPMSCLTITARELGTFFNPQDRELVDLLVALWDSPVGVFRKLTKTQGEDVIENPCLNIEGCTTPSWIRGFMPEYMIGGGFVSRSIWIYADRKRQYVPFPDEVIDANEFRATEERLVHDLNIMASLFGPFTITPEARAWTKDWYIKHWSERPSHMASERYDGYLARKQTHICKLAMILSVAQSDSLVISEKDLSAAAGIVTALEEDMQKVFHHVGAFAESRVMAELLTLVRATKGMPRHELWRRIMPMVRGHKEFQILLEGAVAAGYVRLSQQGDTVYVLPVG